MSISVALPSRTLKAYSQLDGPDAFKEKVLETDFSDIHVMYNAVLVAPYVRPERTAGGILLPDQNVEEDIWQGKAGLVLKLGPRAFVDDETMNFHGETVSVGDWITYWVGDARQIAVKEIPCRLVQDVNIRMKVADPRHIV